MGKKRKIGETSSSAPVAKNKVVKYSDLPDVQKKTWVLCDELNLLDELFKLLDWMVEWGCLEGHDFDGIRSLRCVRSYPLVKLKIVYQQNSRRFLISRATLYILAFHSSRRRGWRVFADSEWSIAFERKVKARQLQLPASYEGKGEPWNALGVKPMIDAFACMDSRNDLTASKATMVFAVHLCEASRIKLLRLKIAGTMMPCVSTAEDIFQGENEMLDTESCTDILPSLRPIIVDLNLSVPGDDQVVAFIKHFKQLCKAWMVYFLSRNTICSLKKEIADACGVKFVRTLRHSLLLLSNTSLAKIREEWVKKFDQRTAPANFLKADLDYMESTISKFEGA